MSITTISARTDTEIKKAAEDIFEALGINMSTAINIFLRQTIYHNGLPFDMKLDSLERTSIKAIEESDKIAHDPNIKGYNSISDLKASLES